MPDGLRRKVHEIRCNRAGHLADHRGGRGRPARLLQQAADLRRYRHRHRHDPGGTAELPRRESQDLLPLRTSLDRSADAELRYARPLPGNEYKVTLARNLIVSVLSELSR